MFSERKGIKEADIFVKKKLWQQFFQELLFLDGGKYGTNHMNTKSDKMFVQKGNLSEKDMTCTGVIKVRLDLIW